MNISNKLRVLLFFVYTIVCVSAFSSEKPNIILCMADDQGWMDVAYNGNTVLKTPNLDELSEAGLRFDQFHAAAPVCSPTRGSVLTGRHPNRFGCFRWGYDLRPQEITIAEALKTAGYATAHFGKWHLGSVLKGSPVNPGNSGFDEWYSAPDSYDMELDPMFSHQGTVIQREGDSSLVTTELALEFIHKQVKADQPFLTLIWFGSPHRPHESAREFKEPYLDQGEKADFLGEIAGIDSAVGMLRRELRDLGIEQDTILWYCSDNGGLFHETAGGRGKKASYYEGGLRVPGIIEWPGHIELNRKTSMPANTVDIYPTLLDIVGVSMDNQPVLDGISLLPLIKGQSQTRLEPMGFWGYDRFIGRPNNKTLMVDLLKSQQEGTEYVPSRLDMRLDAAEVETVIEPHDFYGRAAWLDWPWKLHRIEKEDKPLAYELYNLETDPMEENDVAAQNLERVESLKARLEGWMESVINSQNGGDY